MRDVSVSPASHVDDLDPPTASRRHGAPIALDASPAATWTTLILRQL